MKNAYCDLYRGFELNDLMRDSWKSIKVTGLSHTSN